MPAPFSGMEGISLNKIGYGLSAAALFCAATALAQQPASPGVVGPVPSALAAARSVFVSNGGSDSGLFPAPFSGDQDRAYTQFYAALKATGQFEMASDPSQADLVLELRLTAPYGPTNPNKQNGASDPLPMFRLVVYDRKSHYVLWTVTESVGYAILQKTHDHNFDEALEAVLNRFLTAADKAPAASR
jgi:hypothetical protein